jgi:YVTN family beta-propeller protein
MSSSARVLSVCLTTVLLSCYLPPLPNNRPDPPVITGPSEGWTDSAYTFTLLGKDPDSNNIRLRVSWGDGDTSDWTPFIHSGESTQVSHAWSSPGTFVLRAQAMDWKDSVSEWSKGKVAAFDRPAFPHRVVGTILSDICTATALAVTPNGDKLFVAGAGGVVYTVDTRSDQVKDSLWMYDVPMRLAVENSGDHLYIGFEHADYLLKVRVADNSVVDSAHLKEDDVWALALLPNDSLLYTASWDHGLMEVFRTSDCEPIDSLRLVPHVGGFAMLSHGRYLYATERDSGRVAVIRTSDNTKVADFETRYAPFDIVVLPGDTIAYLSNRGTGRVTVVRIPEHTLSDSIIAGPDPMPLSVVPDGEYVYVGDGTDSILRVIGTAGNSVVMKIPVVYEAWAIAVLPDGSKAYVAGIEGVTVLGR